MQVINIHRPVYYNIILLWAVVSLMYWAHKTTLGHNFIRLLPEAL